jgi:phosphate/sulfate permease
MEIIDFTFPQNHGLIFLVAMALAFSFEFVNGFHDTANAVATVIYTRTLRPTVAVALSGFFNFLGVIVTGTAVAYGIVKLLPPEVLMQSPLEAPLAIVLSALISSLSWNLATWYLGIPASSSHTLIGSILGVGLANSFLQGDTLGKGVNWSKAGEIGLSLILSPLIGFLISYLIYQIIITKINNPKLTVAVPEGQKPTLLVRTILICSCIGVSFSHGSNDGQKGVGLILIIFMAFVPGYSAPVPVWVIISVALALGLGTTVGWKRIVFTVGEKIGKTHLTPLQGSIAEVTAATTILASSTLGLPVSTTQVLSSGVAGTMVAAGSGLQTATIKKILLTWVLTLPSAMLLSGLLLYLFRFIFGIN